MLRLQLQLSLTSLLFLCFAVFTLPGSNAQCSEMDSSTCSTTKVAFAGPAADSLSLQMDPQSGSGSLVPRASTNAERLSRGLPLLPPTRRSNQLFPRASPVPTVTYTGIIQAFSNGISLGFVAPDPNYWTPFLVSDPDAALQVQFTLPQGATSGSQLQFFQLNDGRAPFFGLVVGRDSTSSDIGIGSFNYLYLDPVFTGTPAGSTPQDVPSYFSTSSGLDKLAETSVWSVDLTTGLMTVQWINSDSSSPTTQTFVQSNHLYAGGDSNAFHSRYPTPVTSVTLEFVVV